MSLKLQTMGMGKTIAIKSERVQKETNSCRKNLETH